ncbi:MAG: FAD-dependent oxidoreductase [Pseudomonadota bacterium]
MSCEKKKIAVLGAGPSALVAAFRITEEPDWADRYEITVYQQGWRVGGKCATGRDLDKNMRLYEHGIHGFLGCYYNALNVMRRVFDALDRDPKHPLPIFEAAFHGMSGVIRYEMDEGKLKKWPIVVPENPLHHELLDEAQIRALARIDTWMINLVRLGLGGLKFAYARTYRHPATVAYVVENGAPPPSSGAHPMSAKPPSDFDTRLQDGAEALNGRLGQAVAAILAILPPEPTEPQHLTDPRYQLARDALAPAMTQAAAIFSGLAAQFSGVAKAGGGGSESERDRLRRAGLLLDYVAALLRGVLKDKVHLKGFAAIDKYDHIEWLRDRAEASAETIASPLTSSTPNITYQYPDGDSIRQPVMAAGAYLHWTMMTFTYMGEFIQLFEAGSGETLIAPLHEILEKRGVRFAFFHTVTDIRAARDCKEISEVDIDVQVDVAKGEFAYQPYAPVRKKGWKGPLLCWPDRPLYKQLVNGAALEASGADLESFWCDWRPARRKTLKQGEDFDEVILGVSVGGVKHLTKDLAKRDKGWRKMLDASRTVATQAMQIWLNKTPWDLGWNGYSNVYDDYLLSANFMTQPNGQGDFTKYIKYEDWPKEHEPASLLLLCGTLPFYDDIDGTEGAAFPRRLAAQVKHQSIQFLQATGGFMLPGATVAARRGYGDPFSFDFDLLHPAHPEAPGAEKKGALRFDDQYWRVNVNPSDTYVSTPPDSTRHRLSAHDTGFANLSIAGDWTQNGLNVGSMEGSVRSGLLAAEAVLGVPLSDTGVIGYDPTVPKPPGKAAKRARKAAR